MQGYEVTQASADYPLVFLLISSTDHITGLTGASPTVTIAKNAGTFATPAGAVTEVGNGWYKVAANGTDTSTLGPMLLHASATGSDPVDMMFPVVAVNPQSSTAFVSSVPAVTGAVGSVTNSVVAASITAPVIAASVTAPVVAASVTAPVSVAANGLDLVIIESGVNLPQAIAAIGAESCGVTSIIGNIIAFAAMNNPNTQRISSVAINGVRSSVTLSLPSI
jgi:hypothetical protein